MIEMLYEGIIIYISYVYTVISYDTLRTDQSLYLLNKTLVLVQECQLVVISL